LTARAHKLDRVHAILLVVVTLARVGELVSPVGSQQVPAPLVVRIFVNVIGHDMSRSVEFKTYLFSYSYQGAECVMEIRAADAEDARKRLGRLQYARYDGELVAKIPTSPSLNSVLRPFVRFFVWLLSPGRNN
jgi:hypothetical protein